MAFIDKRECVRTPAQVVSVDDQVGFPPGANGVDRRPITDRYLQQRRILKGSDLMKWPAELLLIRHAESAYNNLGLFGDLSDNSYRKVADQQGLVRGVHPGSATGKPQTF
jgi:hypothetical protein